MFHESLDGRVDFEEDGLAIGRHLLLDDESLAQSLEEDDTTAKVPHVLVIILVLNR